MAEWKKIIVSGSGVAQLSNDANYLTDYTVTESDVTQHQAALTITESQISDLVLIVQQQELKTTQTKLILQMYKQLEL